MCRTIHCKTNARRHWLTIHWAAYVCTTNYIMTFLKILWKSFPLCFKNSSISSTIINQFLHNVIRIKSCSINLSLTTCNSRLKLIESIKISPVKSTTVSLHSYRRNSLIINTLPLICGHFGFNYFCITSKCRKHFSICLFRHMWNWTELLS